MALQYRKFYTKLWGQLERSEMNDKERLFFLYLWIGPDSNSSGLFEFSLSRACNLLGFTEEDIKKLLAKFQMELIIQYDIETSLIWVIEMCRLNVNTQREKISLIAHYRSIYKYYTRFSKVYLILDNFKTEYPELFLNQNSGHHND